MADPFQELRDQGLSTMGYGVVDAPDQRLRKIALLAQQGQALSDRDANRLAQRMGVELETARVARAATGMGGAGVPVSTVDYLAGSRLDPRVQQAAAIEATRAIEFEPLLRSVQLARAQQEIEASRYASSPAAIALRDAEAEARLAELARVKAQNQPFGSPMQELAGEDLVPAAPVVQAVPTPPAVPVTPVTATEVEPLDARLAKVLPVPVGTREQIYERELARKYGTRPVSMAQRSQLREALAPKQEKRTIADPLTGASYEVDVDVDALGNVSRVGAATKKGEGQNEAVDKEFAKEFQTWTTGGSQQLRTNIAELRDVAELLRSPDTKMASGALVSLLPESVRTRVASTEAGSARARIEQVVQQSLREILGAQFTAKEGAAFLERAFDPRMPEEENARRAEVLAQTLERRFAEKDAAAQYYAKAGTLAGFKPPALPSVEGLVPAPKTEMQQATEQGVAEAQAAALRYLSKQPAPAKQ